MNKVMPSQIVAVIDQLFPHAQRAPRDGVLTASHSTQRRGLLGLIEAIPDELLGNSARDYTELVLATSTISETLAI
jgi:hypothetical protein